MNALVIGGGIFGITAALELRHRGADVTLLEAGALPNPLAESTDISKAVRMDYGADAEYAARMDRALVAWRSSPFFHETGLLYLSQGPMKPGGFEHDSFEVLQTRGKKPQRLDAAAIRARYPAWNADRFVDGYFNPIGGWAESGKVVAALAAEARLADVQVVENARTVALLLQGDRVIGATAGGQNHVAEETIVAAGAWTPVLVPWLANCFKRAAQPVFHLKPADPSRFSAERFPTFGADIATTGYYGFPLHPNGVLKIAHHGPGRDVSPDEPRLVLAEQERALRDFLRWAFPELAEAPLAASRTCVYCDTRDEHFWIAKDPQHPGLTVAAGGSGHAFKFAPLLGAWIADAVEQKSNPELHKFRWRPEIAPARGEEAARQHQR